MPRRPALPSYRKHKQSGQAVVTFRLPGGKRKDYLLGRYGSKESKAEYTRLLTEFQAGHQSLPGSAGVIGDVTINELLVRYLRHCSRYYRAIDGTPTGQDEVIRYALRSMGRVDEAISHFQEFHPARPEGVGLGPLQRRACPVG